MRALINYLRSWFCHHDFIIENGYKTLKINDDVYKKGDVISMTCKKCAYHKTIWKYI